MTSFAGLLNMEEQFEPKIECAPENALQLTKIIKLDLSNQRLTQFPLHVFQLPSLRILNLAQNAIEIIPELQSVDSHSNSTNVNCSTSLRFDWKQSSLEEVYLHDNRLETVPECIFELHSLQILDLSNNKLRCLPYKMWTAPKLKELNLSLNLLRELPKMDDDCGLISLSALKRNISNLEGLSDSTEDDKFSEVSNESEPSTQSEDLKQHQVKHLNFWTSNVEVTVTSFLDEEFEKNHHCKLQSLNLSHNGFTSIPSNLSCLAVNLNRLNFSYNCLSRLGCVKLYPANLKHVDISHNQISSWFETHFDNESDVNCRNCYNPCEIDEPLIKSPSRSQPHYCIHKQHIRLDNLRTLIVSHNQLSSLDIIDTHVNFEQHEHIEGNVKECGFKKKICFPNVSMLDVSNNQIREIPENICELSNLSVINVSGNIDIVRLPPQMGLLNKLWNLKTQGCNLSDPLKSMIESKKYKTMDIIGYLKSILEDSKSYARMKLMLVGVQGIGKTSLLELLRQEGTGSYKKRPPEHWAKRRGHKNVHLKTPKGVTLSTVGVDVADWTYEKKGRGKTSFGPVSFRTWDFGGQKEYYATHQYFLTKRSLYLVVWKMIDGEKGVDNIHRWLVNIQARAPNAYVIIVGTHYDLMGEYFPRFYTEDLQQMIREKFISVIDPDKIGLPRVVDSIEISIKTRYNIKKLCNLIYDTAFEIRSPGSKERLLEQKVPATYLALEDVISCLVEERRIQGKDPVLRAEKYKAKVIEEMNNRYGKKFRDVSELHQATAFLHENGVLLHYDDATLKDLYFLDPQWLCDVLAHVITIREINPYAKRGIMKTDDLKLMFKSSCSSSDAKDYIVSLLNKFEVALTWDSRTLVIPSLLPKEENLDETDRSSDVRVPLRSRGWSLRNSYVTPSAEEIFSPNHLSNKSISSVTEGINISSVNRPIFSVYRLLIMTYFPSGFWSRLMTRVLADDFITDIIRSYFIIPKEAQSDPAVIALCNRKAEWTLWQTGMSLQHFDIEIFRVKEVLSSTVNKPFDYTQMYKFLIEQEDAWTDVEINKTSILEIYLPNQLVNIEYTAEDGTQNTFFFEPNEVCVAKLLALTVEHIDTLLEDWYPSLGTRFIHTSEGKFLVTRLVPCTKCINSCILTTNGGTIESQTTDNYISEKRNEPVKAALNETDASDTIVNGTKSCDSGISEESIGAKISDNVRSSPKNDFIIPKEGTVVFSFIVEDCVCKATVQNKMVCPIHGALELRRIAPDTVFADLGEQFVINPEDISRGKMLGRGAFGFVFESSIKTKDSETPIKAAMKMLQPVDPGRGARLSDTVAYKAACTKWERDPMQYSCKAYCIARQELNILLVLKHPHIVPLIGVCTNPLSLILRLAPLGSLDIIIKEYRKCGVKFDAVIVQKVLLQVAKALEYLHQQRIIYRDLKSENVLVWEMPSPDNVNVECVANVDVKLADYGISRACLPTGTKGFGGTEGFMAPEIMRYNGEEEYTEKVDCFSFAMFMYELISLHLPFEGFDNVKDHILDGGRPSLTQKNTLYPAHILDLMTLCWSQLPKDRPNMSQIVSMTSAPEFIHMLDAVMLSDNQAVLSATVNRNSRGVFEIWISRLGKQMDLLICNSFGVLEYKTLSSLKNITVMSVCVVPESGVWLGDSKAVIYVYCNLEYKQVNCFRLDPEDDTPTAVRTINYLSSFGIVAISSSNGRLWLCDKKSLKLQEISSHGVPFLCLTAVDRKNFFELWCGQAEGNLTIISVSVQEVVTSQEMINIYDNENKQTPLIERLDIFDLISDDCFVWTYLCTGCIVFQWNIENRSCLKKLDCSKLVPCSESLLTISIEDHILLGKCQISAMSVMEDELYIGTTGGCLIVVEAATMRPVTVFRPYEEEIKIIVPVPHFREQAESANTVDKDNFLLTLGKGFRSLIARYTNTPEEGLSLTTQKGLFALLWKTGNWNT